MDGGVSGNLGSGGAAGLRGEEVGVEGLEKRPSDVITRW